MNTPIVDFLKNYYESDISRLHMPGHKGVDFLGMEHLDITEIRGADELYSPEGIIAESEANATSLFGTGLTVYSTEGSSHGVRSMLFLAVQLSRGSRTVPESNGKRPWSSDSTHQKPIVLAARNAHKSFLYGAALFDLSVEWLYPEENAENSIAACQARTASIHKALEQMKMEDRLPIAVYITSPDYLGQCANIREIAEICHSYGVLLLVDNAHGAYLHFLDTPMHPMDLGADLCCDSAHKTLPVLTGGAYLHVSKELVKKMASIDKAKIQVKAAMEVSGTTSPSYIIMASLDQANAYMANHYEERLSSAIAMVDAYKAKLTEKKVPLLETEGLKLVVSAAALGFTGKELGDVLRKYQAEPEFCDEDYLVCMITPETERKDLDRVYEALLEAYKEGRSSRKVSSLRPCCLEQVISIREAVMAPHEEVMVEESLGRICGAPTVSCPPAVPIAISGERITKEAVELMKAYGFERVSVVAEIE